MRQELAKYIRGKVGRFSGKRESQEIKEQQPFSTQPESIIRDVSTVLQPILTGGNTIGEGGFRRLSDVTLRHHFQAKTAEAQAAARQEDERGQKPSFEDFEEVTGQEWEIQRRVSRYDMPVAQSYIWFPDKHKRDQDWSVLYIGEREERIQIKFRAKIWGTRDFKGLDIPNEVTFDFRFIKGRDGQDEYIEVVFNNKLFVLDKTGTMLDERDINSWAAAHGWKPSSEAESDPGEKELKAFLGEVTAIGWQEGRSNPDEDIKGIDTSSSS